MKNMQYDKYLEEHRANVKKAYFMIEELAIQLCGKFVVRDLIFTHDDSKDNQDEYDAYVEHFYGEDSNPSDFDRAWLMHIHRNPHHWQHWILQEDSGNTKLLDIPMPYIIEMACDWHSFSAKDPTSTAFKFYLENQGKMQLSWDTQKRVLMIVNYLHQPLKKI